MYASRAPFRAGSDRETKAFASSDASGLDALAASASALAAAAVSSACRERAEVARGEAGGVFVLDEAGEGEHLAEVAAVVAHLEQRRDAARLVARRV